MKLSQEVILTSHINVLFTSAGRRGYLLDWFRESGGFRKIIAVNSEPCTAFAHADEWEILPESTHESFERHLFEVIEKHRIGLVIPLTDLDSLVMSRLSDQLIDRDVVFFGSSSEMVEKMIDKGVWAELLTNAGFPIAKTYLTLEEATEAIHSGEVAFPLVIKPRAGTSSRSVRLVWNFSELTREYESLSTRGWEPLEALLEIPMNRRLIFQEFIAGTEYGFDLLADLSGAYEGYFARRKVMMRAGETDLAVTVPNFPTGFSMRNLAATLGVVGVVDLDLIKSESGVEAILDINPRIGGGYAFSHVAGARLPRYVRSWLDGEGASLTHGSVRGQLIGKDVSLVEIPTGSGLSD